MFPASGSEDLASDFTTVVPMNNESISKLAENNHDIKETHQNEAWVFPSSSPCPKLSSLRRPQFSPHTCWSKICILIMSLVPIINVTCPVPPSQDQGQDKVRESLSRV